MLTFIIISKRTTCRSLKHKNFFYIITAGIKLSLTEKHYDYRYISINAGKAPFVWQCSKHSIFPFFFKRKLTQSFLHNHKYMHSSNQICFFFRGVPEVYDRKILLCIKHAKHHSIKIN